MTAMTKWFPPEVKPVRVGWYETSPVKERGGEQMAYWSGGKWLWHAATYECLFQHRHWRGLKAPAK